MLKYTIWALEEFFLRHPEYDKKTGSAVLTTAICLTDDDGIIVGHGWDWLTKVVGDQFFLDCAEDPALMLVNPFRNDPIDEVTPLGVTSTEAQAVSL